MPPRKRRDPDARRKRDIQNKVQDLLFRLDKERGDFGRRAIFKVGGYGDKWTVITQITVGAVNHTSVLYYIDNVTGDMCAPVYPHRDASANRNPPSGEIFGNINDKPG